MATGAPPSPAGGRVGPGARGGVTGKLRVRPGCRMVVRACTASRSCTREPTTFGLDRLAPSAAWARGWETRRSSSGGGPTVDFASGVHRGGVPGGGDPRRRGGDVLPGLELVFAAVGVDEAKLAVLLRFA